MGWSRMRGVHGILATGAALSLIACGTTSTGPDSGADVAYDVGAPLYGNASDFRTFLATSACPTSDAKRADLAMQLHTELMVAGLGCSAGPTDPLFSAYGDFTFRHQTELREAQDVLEDHFADHDSGDPARRFDTYRTRVANDESQTLMADGRARYCAHQRRLLATADEFSSADLDRFLDSAMTAYGDLYPGCAVRTAQRTP